MQSPAMHPVDEIYDWWMARPVADLRIFLSTGARRDNEAMTRHFRSLLEKKGYEVGYVEVDAGHDWENWRPLLDDVLLYFFAAAAP